MDLAFKQLQSQSETVTIVVVGNFNPAIFHPAWLAKNNLIREEEAQSADVALVSGEATIFDADWLKLQVTQERFIASTRDPSKYRPLRDLVLSVFKLLEHTPVTAVGLNTDAHYKLDTLEEWHSFGHFYVPKSTWSSLLENAGMKMLIVEGTRQGSGASKVEIQVQPSPSVKFGVFFHLHQHYELANQAEKYGNKSAMTLLLTTIDNEWDDFLLFAGSAAKRLFADFRAAK